jgi:quercetin dioxygenase-like cupin family protein
MEVRSAEVVLPAPDLDATVAFFTDRLGFRVAAVVPADDPLEVLLEGHGLRVRLRRGAGGAPGVLRLLCADSGGASELIAPNGTHVEIATADPEVALPPLRPAFTLAKREDAEWRGGRAGMRYRDLIPDRQGGRFIASHIVIQEGGPVPDYVHFHRIRFQMIYCYNGWVRVVYEDQGPPFVMNPGDCVLQPPRIRHRVLESAVGAEVIEIASPAEHETLADPTLALPTAARRPERELDGQRFVRHELSSATWDAWRSEGFEARDLGITAATRGAVSASVVRAREGATFRRRHEGELLFTFALRGAAVLRTTGRHGVALTAGDAFVIPAGQEYGLDDCREVELLEVAVPAVALVSSA